MSKWRRDSNNELLSSRNPKALAENLKTLFPDKKITFSLGVLAGRYIILGMSGNIVCKPFKT